MGTVTRDSLPLEVVVEVGVSAEYKYAGRVILP